MLESKLADEFPLLYDVVERRYKMAFVVNTYFKESWEEPCMNCFKQICYSEEDILKKIVQDNYIPDDVMHEVNYIICPNCGKEMEVHRTDSILL
jgi:hypothetical protein